MCVESRNEHKSWCFPIKGYYSVYETVFRLEKTADDALSLEVCSGSFFFAVFGTFFFFLMLSLGFPVRASGEDVEYSGSVGSQDMKITGLLEDVHLTFEENKGQLDSRVRFSSSRDGCRLFFTPEETVIVLFSPLSEDISPGQGGFSGERSGAVLRMKLLGASTCPHVRGRSPVRAKTNYLFGGNPNQWVAGARLFKEIVYENVYPGIDMVFHGGRNILEYDFILAPGTDPAQIRLDIQGASNIEIDDYGSLTLHTPCGQITQPAPVLFQMRKGAKQPVNGRFIKLSKTMIGFEVEQYDRNQGLVIDPEIHFSTYIGGHDLDYISAICVDINRNIYITGYSNSMDFPQDNTLGVGFCSVCVDSRAFVIKIHRTQNFIEYATYVSANSSVYIHDIVADELGNAYIAGRGMSSRYSVGTPLVNPIPGTFTGDARGAVYMKINPEGDGILFSSALGGSEANAAAIAIDTDHNVYLAGRVGPDAEFPMISAYDSSYNGGTSYSEFNVGDGFIAKISADGSQLNYSTYLGGSHQDSIRAMDVDSDGYIYVTGVTKSDDFPTFRAIQSQRNGVWDVFVTKLTPSGSGLVFSTYLGGRDHQAPYGIAADSHGNSVVAGAAYSPDFPMYKPFQVNNGGRTDGFVTKFDHEGGLLFSTFLGGNGPDSINGVAIDSSDYIYLCGNTTSVDFPLSFPLQDELFGGTDAFVTTMDPQGSLLFSTFWGGTNIDGATSIAVNQSGGIYFCGSVGSTDFPTFRAFSSAWHGNFDGYVTVFDSSIPPSADLSVSKTISAGPYFVGTNLTYTLQIVNNSLVDASGVWVSDTLSEHVTLVSATTSQGSFSGTETILFDLNDLGEGDTATMTITVTPEETGVLENSAFGVSNLPELDMTNNTADIEVQVLSPDADPSFGLDMNDLYFTVLQTDSSPSQQTLSFDNAGGGTLAWTISSCCEWLTVTPESGSGHGDVVVSVDWDGMVPATYEGSLQLTAAGADNSPVAVPVTMRIHPDPLNTGWGWKQLNPLPYGVALRSVLYANGRYLVSGLSGTLLVSPDEKSWRFQFPGVNDPLIGSAFGDDIYVLVGGDTVITSVDGVIWVRQAISSDDYLEDVVFGNHLFVAVGDDGAILTSENGSEWTSRFSGGSRDLMSVAYGNGVFVVVGYNGFIATSSDGFTWVPRSSASENLEGVTFGNGLFVAAGDDGLVITSADGVAWTVQTTSVDYDFWDITYGDGTFVAVGGWDSPQIIKTTDGTTWTDVSYSGGAGLYAVGYGDGRFIAAGRYGYICSSSAGINWSSQPTESLTYETFRGVHSDGDVCIAVGDSGLIARTTDGENWSVITPPNSMHYRSVAFSETIAVAVPSYGPILTSSDHGLAWIDQTPGTIFRLKGVSFGNDRFVAVGQTAGGSADVQTSPDGITWTGQNPGTGNRLYSIVFAEGLFVAVGINGTVITSPDGENWTTADSTVTDSLFGIAYGEGRFVAAGDTVITSINGVDWTLSSDALEDLNAIGFAENRFLAVGLNAAYSSVDGLTWSDRSPLMWSVMNGVGSFNGRFVVVGQWGLMKEPEFLRSRIVVHPSELHFGTVTPGTQSNEQTVIVQNAGSMNLNLGEMVIQGSDAASFDLILQPCSSGSLGPTEACEIKVIFTPGTAGEKTANLLIPSDDPQCDEVSVLLEGGSGDTACSYSSPPSEYQVDGAGDNGEVTITTDSLCNWSASTTAGWIHLTSGPDFTGTGTLTFTVDSNPEEYARNATMTIVDQQMSILQNINDPLIDLYTSWPGSNILAFVNAINAVK